MRKRRFSITQQQAESLQAALALSILYLAQQKAKSEESAHSPYYEMRIHEWNKFNTDLSAYKWEVE